MYSCFLESHASSCFSKPHMRCLCVFSVSVILVHGDESICSAPDAWTSEVNRCWWANLHRIRHSTEEPCKRPAVWWAFALEGSAVNVMFVSDWMRAGRLWVELIFPLCFLSTSSFVSHRLFSRTSGEQRRDS